ncbi:MAG TPA: DUF1059 domain-containing protein [Solirubrobacteraceae bacterium]|nr:DUF1059 domain-containing protein [Solirubrobacteraceae bacterium]
MSRTVFDCARVPGDTCSVQMIGERDDVLAAAKQHLVSAHGHEDNSNLQQNVANVVDTHQQATPYSTWI